MCRQELPIGPGVCTLCVLAAEDDVWHLAKFDYRHFFYHIHYRHVIPALVDRTSASAKLYTHPWIIFFKKNKHTNATRSLRNKATCICDDIHAPMSRKLGGNRVCGVVLCPGCLGI